MADRFEPEANRCPVCVSTLTSWEARPNGRDGTFISCTLCGDFFLSGTLMSTLPAKLDNKPDARAKISHAIRKMQKTSKGTELYSNTIDEILKRPLPTIKEQADLLVRWLAENIPGPGETVCVEPKTHRSIIGAISDKGFIFVLNYLVEHEIITGELFNPESSNRRSHITLSFKGWEYFEELKKGNITNLKAFMAMKFGDPDLDNIVDNYFKKYVLQTGFELYKLDDNPRAGLIDDRLRVEIQNSAFLIADLTHDNPGAYWEAGYAEGLGKPVIYTCEKNKFEKQKPHFDTNHHLTVRWDKKCPEYAGEYLKATIRATLPELAFMERRLLSLEELQDILTTEIRKYEECRECGPLVVRKLVEPDATGCNWTTSDYIRATGVPQTVIGPIVEKVVSAAKSKYNLK